MKTLRQEIEKLRDELKDGIQIRTDYSKGYMHAFNHAANRLTDILSSHTEPEEPTAPFNPQDELKAIQEWIKDHPEQHEKILDEINAQPNIGPTARQMFAMMRCDHPEPTAPSQRERIATACMQGITSNPNFKASTKMCVEAAITVADALIAELSKTTGHVRP